MSAAFSGDPSVHAAAFSGDPSVHAAAFSGDPSVHAAAFSGDPSVHAAAFSGDRGAHAAASSDDPGAHAAEPLGAPLTQNASGSAEPELFGAGLVRSRRFDDLYQPDADGSQARAVFLAGNDLPARFARAEGVFHVLELGFGTGLNFLETWRAWRGALAGTARCELRYVGIDGHPLARHEAALIAEKRAEAVAHSAPLEWDQALLLEAWNWPTRGAHHRPLAGRHPHAHGPLPELELVHDDFEAALVALGGRLGETFDAVYLDGFAPSRNPNAWSATVFTALARLTRPGATVATWSVAGAVRRGLDAVGFDVERRPGHGRKREVLAGMRRETRGTEPDPKSR